MTEEPDTSRPPSENGPSPSQQETAGGSEERSAVEDTGQHRLHLHRLPPLSWKIRFALLVVGWVLMVVGIAGLALPGIQGIVTIVIALAILSIASETAHRWLHRIFHPWPNAWEKIAHLRRRLHDKLSRRH